MKCKAAEEEQKCGNLEEKKNVHYTFDFAQSVLVPGHVRQEGALYYKLPFKVNWFGILNDGKPAMYNYIFSEAQAMSVDNENSHSSSSVVSMFDHFLTMYGESEKKCFINCDNCGGQNKNQTFSSSNPGHVIVKKFATSEELNVRLLKRGKCVTPGNLPVRVEAAGLSPARQWYLYRNIREFLPLKFKDVTAPLPEISEKTQEETFLR
ncbi:hypothetical protein KUTeg_009353 [Tegillarca granosa]|uniref:Uncharacterized protein n=1 Tax=Tegillarca granosa TaxID=220873 RepID=A0ABQ9F6R9_TEGGR|nr:hypothetical protein KUTeg_009353 [Tegillarca granosa]